MLGIKARQFIPAPAVSLEELVPRDHFYRHLEQVLDLTFVRQWVQDDYAACLAAKHRSRGLLQAAAGDVL